MTTGLWILNNDNNHIQIERMHVIQTFSRDSVECLYYEVISILMVIYIVISYNRVMIQIIKTWQTNSWSAHWVS